MSDFLWNKLRTILPQWKGRPAVLKYADLEDIDLNVVRYKPMDLEHLQKVTKFSRRELQIMYRGFKQECPNGMANEETFKTIYAQFFPGGDSYSYAHYVFATFDKERSGTLTFDKYVQQLSLLSRGSMRDRLSWMFTLYDLNGDGLISRQELAQVCSAVYDLLGKHTDPIVTESTPREHAERIFQKMDLNKDGVISEEEFMAVCSQDPTLLQTINCLDTIL